MDKQRSRFSGYEKHFAVWAVVFLIMGLMQKAETGPLIISVFLMALAFSLGSFLMFKGLKKIFGSKDIR